MAVMEKGTTSATVEARTREVGRRLLADMYRGVGIWKRAWWDDRLMGLTMGDPATKVQLFRFIDALPTLTRPDTVHRHLREYLAEAGATVPAVVNAPLQLAPPGHLGDKLVAALARVGATTMARKFIAGSTPDEAFRAVRKLRARRMAFTADLLGEAVITEAEAEAYQQTCLDLLRGLAGPLAGSPEVPQIDRDDHGPIPRANLSLKLTSLTPHFDPMSDAKTTDRVRERLIPILRAARELGAFVNIDMEQYAFKDLTYAIFGRVLDEPEFRDWDHVGIVCQAYLRDALDDLADLRAWAERRGTPVTVRLVKGAYWDYEVLHARQLGWPIPVFEQKVETDANYERCTDFLLANREWLRPAFGSHNVRSIAHAIAAAEALGVPKEGYELQMLHGMAETLQEAVVAEGMRLRLYTPYGAMLPGMAYLVRRLLENTSNESFLKATAAGPGSTESLLQNPEDTAMWARAKKPKRTEATELPPFQNEPPVDFSRSGNRDAMRTALANLRARFADGGLLSIPHIDGRPLPGRPAHAAFDPGDRTRRIGTVHYATAADANAAVEAARRAFPSWAETPAEDRAGVLLRAAEIMRARRFDLAAIEVYECGKPWREADGDIAEAIDFCEFYAREMIRLDRPEHRDVAGETNTILPIPRGVVVVIPPWNFPLAIPTGMTVAPLVAGNAVILKPAEQSSLIAAELVAILETAGLPRGVLGFLPGQGEEVGAALVNHPEVDLVSFTGSRTVGLMINRQASEVPVGQDHVKRVIAEMGGKNAIIVDDDADLDEAVVGILQSAFGYAGQKCSACSRVIALDSVYDALVARLADALPAVPLGPADDPDTTIGPVIDDEARDRILDYQRLATASGRVVAHVDPGPLADRGAFVGPMIVADVAPTARIAQEEVFGPLLTVIRARDLADALAIANGTPYALTGGLYSRSPASIARARRLYRVGNLYINRPITGALVDRQPFGGFKLSGIGTKAGGSDYLREFLLSRVITENTMRRGFAPETVAGDTHATAAF